MEGNVGVLVRSMIISAVAEPIGTKMDIGSPGKEIILMQDVEGAYGIVK